MTADPDPYFALPALYGAPAYARPPRPVLDTDRPLDPDDLPIAAEQTADERELASTLPPGRFACSSRVGAGAAGPVHSGRGSEPAGLGARRLNLRALAGRLAPRER